jgi:hypothetical protein
MKSLHMGTKCRGEDSNLCSIAELQIARRIPLQKGTFLSREDEADGDQFCHIDDGSGLRSFCDAPAGGGGITCNSDWSGDDPWCIDCGRPTCPRCLELLHLEDALMEDVA